MTLEIYEIPKQYKNLIKHILSCQTKEQFQTEVNHADFDFDEKNIFIAKTIKNLEAESAAIEAARDDMIERLKRINSQIQTLSDFIIQDIEKSGLLDPIKCAEFEIKTRNNPPAVVIFDADAIPDCYKITKETITIDKKAIAKEIKDGFEIDGAKLERGKTLIIK